ncbi:MAG: hypothetical protein AMJ62_14385 [Myxococcales bacterium SG8_38]|nr:MAG: hypothetical protein AMJ62_14385 [Myxococcales bacterium SG8_38]
MAHAVRSKRNSTLVWSIFLSAWIGCTSESTPDSRGRNEVDAKKADETAAANETSFTRNYDPQGRLLPSDHYVAGVRMPRGAELFFEDDLRHVYRIRAPIDKVLAYLGPMMITGNVERRGKGAIYKRASVRGAEVSPTKLDVSILEVGSSMTRISITELPPPPAYIPSAEQTKAAARDTWRTLD